MQLLTKRLLHLAHNSNGHSPDARGAGTPEPVRLSKQIYYISKESDLKLYKAEAIAISAENK
ncbi:hypothetical protein AVEN_49849-1, partial [Araneus ventricosus]